MAFVRAMDSENECEMIREDPDLQSTFFLLLLSRSPRLSMVESFLTSRPSIIRTYVTLFLDGCNVTGDVDAVEKVDVGCRKAVKLASSSVDTKSSSSSSDGTGNTFAPSSHGVGDRQRCRSYLGEDEEIVIVGDS
ncbi:hypothetical protein BT69DRAFT_1275739 [Atractiella rhizophila]|nr:hypothetical protein BT69DRAFT_1275739 [Atractiella rhizophila]